MKDLFKRVVEVPIRRSCFLIMFLFLTASSASAQTQSVTYQGRLTDGGFPANGTYDIQFALYDAATGTGQIGSTINNATVQVSGGVFTVTLDFGADAFPGEDRFLEIRVRQAGNPNPHVILNPRQPITSSPYSIRSLNSETSLNAVNAAQLGGVAADQFVLTGDSRLSDARPPTAGSGDYIQNTASQQALSNFNISGNGTAGGTFSGSIINAQSRYDLGGNPILRAPGTNNTFTGLGAGAANTTGQGNAFFGTNAGVLNTSGDFNAIFGSSAGVSNTTGIRNAFFGTNSGRANVGGNDNSFYGTNTGFNNTSGLQNSFFGSLAGVGNTTGDDNSFFGANAGFNNSTASGNSFFGSNAGSSNTTGNNNAFFGRSAGSANTTGDFNAIFGSFAGVSNTTGIRNAFFGTNSGRANVGGNDNSFYGTNTGFNTTSGLQNSFFGSLAGVGNTTGDDNSFFGANAGFNNSTASGNSFFGSSAGSSNTTGNNNAFFGRSAGSANTTGQNDAFFGFQAGFSNTIGQSNAFFGHQAGLSNTTGGGNSFFGRNAGTANVTGSQNAFFGELAGNASTGDLNSFFGNRAGFSDTTGIGNSFFGAQSGFSTTTGGGNTFFGTASGLNNQGGANNSFFGNGAGVTNTTGSSNTIIGKSADVGSNNLSFATALGAGAVVSTSNTIVLGRANGSDAVIIPGPLNANGSALTNLNASNITSGTLATDLGGTGLTAAGSAGNFLRSNGTVWTTSALQPSDLPPGNGNYIQNQNSGPQAASNFNISGSGTVGGTLSANVVNSSSRYNLGNDTILRIGGSGNTYLGIDAGPNSTGIDNTFIGNNAGKANANGNVNTFVGHDAGQANTASNNSFFGNGAGNNNTSGMGNSFFGTGSGFTNTTGSSISLYGLATLNADGITNATAIGARSRVDQDNSLVLGSISGINSATADTNVGIGTTAPTNLLTIGQPEATVVNGSLGIFSSAGTNLIMRETTNNVEGIMGVNNSSGVIYGSMTAHGVNIRTNNTNRLVISSTGLVSIANLGAAGATALCRNASDQISTCSSSARYKSNISSFRSGLDLVRRLRPVSFNWKEGGMRDMGLVAEDVAAVEPLLTTTNEKGEVEGVKYDRIGVVLINAVKEQQEQIKKQNIQLERQQKQLQQQQVIIDGLRQLVCKGNPGADVCKEEK